jgi:hypothetical protein
MGINKKQYFSISWFHFFIYIYIYIYIYIIIDKFIIVSHSFSFSFSFYHCYCALFFIIVFSLYSCDIFKSESETIESNKIQKYIYKKKIVKNTKGIALCWSNYFGYYPKEVFLALVYQSPVPPFTCRRK